MFAALRKKNLHTWLPGYAAHLGRQLRGKLTDRVNGTRHLLFAVCDHYEPLWGKQTSRNVGLSRVKRWSSDYPRLAERFHDGDGHAPRHSFFFPGEEYAPSFLEDLAGLARAGLGEVELHLHHDNDTAENLRACIEEYLELFAEHGHMSRLEESGSGASAYRYAFIHGNWCLANARRDGRWCGVDNELPLLFDTGCYADFTFPSAPDECQPPLVNQIYWPTGELGRRRAYQSGEAASVGQLHHDRLLMMTGPLALSRRPGGMRPRIESAALDAGDPPSAARVHDWVRQNIHIEGRPEWTFVKVHTHGAPEANAAALLGGPGVEMHETLARHYNDGVNWKLHYVTAREMYNIAVAAMAGVAGDPGALRDYDVPPPPIATV